MKLRLQGNSLRLRLSQSEVARFAASGVVEDTVDFGNGSSLQYCLKKIAGAHAPRAAFTNGRITIEVPGTQADAWTASDKVGISGTSGSLSILIEKDFKCLHPEQGGNDPDAFPNPLETQAH